ncbi:hypothetical protein [Streptomyces goshikiensis]|uniref:hypothetical protein n=1 Tax=Streptomyces goshikiensis TaxID=1942 RepID=UPI0033A7D7AC
MGRSQTENLEGKHQRWLEAYVVRARRVEEHSLAADWDALVDLTRMKIEVRRFANGEVRIRHELPPEEVVESAAARIRPILLETEDCFHMKALRVACMSHIEQNDGFPAAVTCPGGNGVPGGFRGHACRAGE